MQDLATKSGVSISSVYRIENGERYPSGRFLGKLAKPLGFKAEDLLTLAGYLTPLSEKAEDNDTTHSGRLDPDIANMLAKESITVQRAAAGILSIIQNLAKAVK